MLLAILSTVMIVKHTIPRQDQADDLRRSMLLLILGMRGVMARVQTVGETGRQPVSHGSFF